MTIAELNRELERRQQELAPKEDLGEYVGQWVILRNGRVIASSPDPKELRDHDDLRSGDVLILVGDPEGGYFL